MAEQDVGANLTRSGAIVLTALGLFPGAVFAQGSLTEVTIDYSSGTAELPFGGVVVNHIPREGGNTFKVSFFEQE